MNYLSKTERRIINGILNRALAAGYEISVNDGEETTVSHSTNLDQIVPEIGTTDQTFLRFYTDSQFLGAIWLVHGNDEDVVTDYHDNPQMEQLING